MLLSLSFIGILKGLILVFFTLSALLLILIVLLQEPKGGGLAAAFGGAGAETFGVQSGSVNKFTTYVSGVFIVLAILYAMIRPTGDEDAVLAPEWTFNGLIRYSWDMSAGSIAVQVDGNWKDDHNFNLSFTPVIEEESYGVANARISFTTSDEAWLASVFVKNFTDENYRSYAFDTSGFFGAIEDVPGHERWVGANVRYRW